MGCAESGPHAGKWRRGALSHVGTVSPPRVSAGARPHRTQGDAPPAPGGPRCLLSGPPRRRCTGISHPRHGHLSETDAPVFVAAGGKRSELGVTDGKAARLIKPFVAPHVVGSGPGATRRPAPVDLGRAASRRRSLAGRVAPQPAPGREARVRAARRCPSILAIWDRRVPLSSQE